MSDDEKTQLVRPGELAAMKAAADAAPKKTVKAKLLCLDSSMLAPSQKGLTVVLKEGEEQVMGRGKTNPIFIDSMRVSREHAAVYPVDGGWGIRDLKSTNGVFINEKRISDAKLKHGDLVKLGTIPFRFEIEEVEAGAPRGLERFSQMGDEDSEKTMMFGDVRASKKLLAAQDAKETAEPAAPAKKAAQPVVQRVARPVDEPSTIMDAGDKPRAKLPVVKIVFYAFIAAIIVVGGYFGVGMLRESNIVETKRDAVNRFVREAATGEDPKRFGDERKSLAKLKLELAAAIAEAPDKPELGLLLGRVIILEFERNFYEAMTANNFGNARDAIAAARKELAAAKQSGGQTEAENMLGAVEPVIALREFGKEFPDPRQKSPAPAQARVNELLKLKTEFTTSQKTVNMDLVRYPYLGKLLDQGNLDIRLVERWGSALGAAG